MMTYHALKNGQLCFIEEPCILLGCTIGRGIHYPLSFFKKTDVGVTEACFP
ncbi:hypothetical protein SAMN06265784_113122 [Paraburkholderia susongensis]|uniref:Uncharacterized protein n=1 Tax=Paraburkholderia susongensis TaxID=1515439 RepID=A0A1X7M0T0_9BURK|nr:hypothetical protein SAMN06265784_113122 [Paraburkholderia susongensis]